jgi:hypothetical protein
LAKVHQALPAGSGLIVCRPTPVVRRILAIAAMEQLATIRDGTHPTARVRLR